MFLCQRKINKMLHVVSNKTRRIKMCAKCVCVCAAVIDEIVVSTDMLTSTDVNQHLGAKLVHQKFN